MPDRTVQTVMQGHATSDGAGVKLVRVFDPRQAQQLDPFLLFDEFRSEEASDYVAGFPPHPHRGFETVTYMVVGRMQHKDNHGNAGDLGPGGVQWMSAARGIVHEERPQQDHGLMWGYQLWVNLPAANKMDVPWYDDIAATRIPTVVLPGGGTVRVIAGAFGDVRGPVRPRPAEPTYLDVDLPANARCEIAIPAGHTALVHGVTGKFRIGADGASIASRQCALLSREGNVVITTGGEPGRVLVLAGKPFGEPIAHHGPFVMNSPAELRQAIDDFQNDRF
ncbi:MAG: pirin family protein [Planctomycetes bacterium]|nr:pirin family protein [Planctomycetota bacterium]